MPRDDTADQDMSKLLDALNTDGEQSESVITSLADAATAEPSLVNESEIAPPKPSASEEEATKTGEEEQKAEAEKPAKGEDRDRIYLHDGLSSRRKAEIQLLADNPDLESDQVKALVDKKLEGIDDEFVEEVSVIDQAQAAKDRLAEVNAALRIKEKDFKHDDEWEKLSEEKDKLLVEVPELDVAARIEAGRDRQLQNHIEAAEAEAHKLVPSLADETSPEYAQAAGRVAQLIAIKDGGKELPTIEVDGVKLTLDPDRPDFPLLVAKEIAAGKESKATEATPVATEQRQTVKRQLVPTPASSPVSAQQKQQPEGAENRVSLKDKAAAVQTVADLNVILDEDGGAWNTGSSRFAKNVL